MKEEFQYQIKEILGVASTQENLNSSWVKAVLTTLKGKEEELGVDVRNFNLEQNRMGIGVRLTPQEANRVCDILLSHGYGSLEVMEEQMKKRKGVFEETDVC